MAKILHKNLIFFVFGFLLFSFVMAGKTQAATYFNQGTLLSTNILSGVSSVYVLTIFNATTTIPASTTVSVQFSQDGTNFFNASNTAWAWTSLASGTNAINLIGFNWVGANFYYKLKLESTASTTSPTVQDVAVNYNDTPFIPTVTTNSEYVYSRYEAWLDGTITATNGENADQRGFEWGTSTGSYIVGSAIESGNYAINSIFQMKIAQFQPGTTYYYRAKAHNSIGWGYGSERSFTTPAVPAYSSQGTLLSTNILSGVSSVYVLTIFNATTTIPASTTVSVQFSQDGTNFYNASNTVGAWTLLASGTNAIDLVGLNFVGANFYYKLKLETTASTSSPTVQDVAVNYNDTLVIPTVTTNSEYVYSRYEAWLNGTITATNGENADQRGFEWGTSTGSYIVGSAVESGNYAINTSFQMKIAQFQPGTTYYYRAKAHNSIGWGYGGERSFTTPEGPRYSNYGVFLSNNYLSGITADSINYFGYNVSSLPASTTISVQFSQDNTNWYNASGTLWAWQSMSSGYHLSTSTAISLSSLSWSGSNFYYKIKFETLISTSTPVLDAVGLIYYILPSVTTASSTQVASKILTANGVINSVGSDPVTVRGFKYGLTATSTWTVSESSNYPVGPFKMQIPNLSPNTMYYVRTFATNEGGTAYGAYISTTTMSQQTGSSMMFNKNLKFNKNLNFR
ncbi:hypothetical protein L6270_00010 [Candidatus Parcubacteria bacterium]|nr:hypothetical protein [Patescibacteria group bacterium]MBU4309538.1 hypothetical protein [Patescibacteria group bacterium]MBU4432532.1 hypothetical protein [Patescibacteria group bacterium]MBU4578074.1 hypothetical protein [Patescibacteria group bacterium]MCG2696418.1 hypothetical protein [Candidatus Parcubacteria bacterium]